MTADAGATEYKRRPLSVLWDWIKGKADAAYLRLTGGDMTGYLNFNQTNMGLSWTHANGDRYNMRSYSPSSVFQITRYNPNGISEYGVFNIDCNGWPSIETPDHVAVNLGMGIVAYGADYVRWNNGLQVCWGFATLNQTLEPHTTAGLVFTLPVPFRDTAYSSIAAPFIDSGNSWGIGIRSTSHTTYNFSKLIVNQDVYTVNSGMQFNYICIGYWK